MRKVYIVLITLATFLFCINIYCTDKKKSAIAEGNELAKIHCASCHGFPDPSLLDKKTWQRGVLPKMAELMYVDKYYDPFNNIGRGEEYPIKVVSAENLFPYTKWEKIVNYYLATAPDSPLERKNIVPAIEKNLPNFDVHEMPDSSGFPLTTLVKFDTVLHRIIVGDGRTGKVLSFNPALKIVDSFTVGLGIADIRFDNTSSNAVTMGILRPSDMRLGQIVVTGKTAQIILDSLQRPVQASYADLNGDNREDIVVCEFGYRSAGLSWFENKGSGQYEKHWLRALPGATASEVYDFNKDGKPDIIALMAQADEGVFIYYNTGNGQFREERVLHFPPVYGFNSMQLYDFNKDGFMDILTTNGDNADYSAILKPYHGVRLFLNNGKNKFTEKTFLPAYGAQRAMGADFDNDGDIDIVSTSFFPDYNNLPEESFIYWENSGDFTYKRYTFPGSTDARWMTFDIGDMDADGDKDIILGGSLVVLNVPDALKEKWIKRPLAAVILENKLIQK